MTPFNKYNYFKISLIEERIENVFLNLDKYLSEGNDALEWSTKDQLDFNIICDRQKLDYNGKPRFMLFEPSSNPHNTVFFSNAIDGWYTLIYNYARLFKVNIFQIGITSNKRVTEYPAYFFTKLFYNDTDELQERVVYLIKENSWKFNENSDKVKPLELETPQLYVAKRKTERLNTDIILDYMNKAGYNLRNEMFFKTNYIVYYGKWK